MIYGYTKELALPFTDAIARVRGALEAAGFGIPVEMNAQEILKKKIDKDIEPYYILGACHPSSAYQAIQAEVEIGLLLPCNVLLYEKNRKVFVSMTLPTVAMQMVDNSVVASIAQEVEEKLKGVLDRL